MNRVFKTILMWLMVLAIPMQGFASVVCGPNHHRNVLITKHVAHSHEGMMHAHADHDHHQLDQQLAADDDTTNDSSAALDKPANSKCSSCAACCVGVAMLSS